MLKFTRHHKESRKHRYDGATTMRRLKFLIVLAVLLPLVPAAQAGDINTVKITYYYSYNYWDQRPTGYVCYADAIYYELKNEGLIIASGLLENDGDFYQSPDMDFDTVVIKFVRGTEKYNYQPDCSGDMPDDYYTRTYDTEEYPKPGTSSVLYYHYTETSSTLGLLYDQKAKLDWNVGSSSPGGGGGGDHELIPN